MLEVVAQTKIDRQLARNGPSVIGEGANVRNTEIRAHCTKGLSEFIRVARGEIRQVGKDVGSAETVRYASVLVDMVDNRASFPEVMPSAPRVRIGELAMCFTASSIPV